jgi:rod shape determining protein RodA
MKERLQLFLAHGDHLTTAIFLALVLLGGVMVRSATFGTRFAPLASRQMLYDVLAVAVFFLAAWIPYEIWIEYSYLVYGACVALLLAVFPLGHSVAGSRSWIYLGPVGFQPSEFAKVGAALACAGYIKDLSHREIGPREFLVLSGIIGAPFLLTLVQPDFGTATTFLPLVIAVFFLSRMRLRQILKLAGAGVLLMLVLFSVGWFTFLKPYQKERLMTFVKPATDPKGAGYQVHQARIAVGSGEVTGKGLFSGTQNRLNFLPAPHTDFIFGVVSEELGFLGSITVVGLFLALLSRFLSTLSTARDAEGRFLVLGAFFVFLYHLTINVGMVIGLVPTAGIPLPFLSYGGSFLLGSSLLCGLAANVRARRYAQ